MLDRKSTRSIVLEPHFLITKDVKDSVQNYINNNPNLSLEELKDNLFDVIQKLLIEGVRVGETPDELKAKIENYSQVLTILNKASYETTVSKRLALEKLNREHSNLSDRLN